MKLMRAYGIRAKDVVSIVGGGGKTSAMFRLADELVAEGKRVVTTTTTRIFVSQIQLAPFHLFAHDKAQTIRDTRAALREHPHVLVMGTKSQDGKAFGVEADLVDRLVALEEVDVVLVEADGSRRRSFKAPNESEPVIPPSTTLLVPVVGIDVLEMPLDDEYVHRSELVARILNIPRGTPLKAEDIASVLANPQGGLKNKPPGARTIPMINKVEDEAQAMAARNISALLLQNDAIDAVAVGALRNHEAPISALYTRVSAVILAAGGSTRMRGEPKQLLPWGKSTLIRNALDVVRASRVSEVVVVTGNRAGDVEQELAIGDPPKASGVPVRIVYNPDWATGRASSVRAGIQAVNDRSTAAIFINADQPFLSADVIDSILQTFFTTGATIVVPTFDGVMASPVLFAREMYAELCSLHGEHGGRDMLQKYSKVLTTVAVADGRAAIDVDTPEEYQTAFGRLLANESAQNGVQE